MAYRQPPLPTPLLVLGAAAFVAAYWVYDYVLALQYQTPAAFFMWSGAFVSPWLDHPGGLLEVLDRFLRQFFYDRGTGALVVAAWTTLFGGVVYRLRRRLGAGPGVFHTLAPPLCLLALELKTAFAVGMTVSGAAYLVYLSLPGRRAQRLFAVVAAPLVYYAVGGYAWPLALWVVAAPWLDRRRPADAVAAALYGAIALALPWIAWRWVFAISWDDAWLAPVRTPRTLVDGALWACVVTIPVLPALPWPARLERGWTSRWGQAAQAALLVPMATVLLGLTYDPAARHLADAHRLSQARRWEDLLDLAGREPIADGLGPFFVNLALAHRGQLLERMFDYPQPGGTAGLVPAMEDHAAYSRRAMYASDLYYELGHVNAAYKLAYNQAYILGSTYANLRRVAECALVNHNLPLARKYLRLLSTTLHHRDVATRYRALIEAGELDRDEAIAAVRRRRPTLELEIGFGDFACLLALAKSHPDNRMAVDYLTAWCLLDKGALPLVAQDVGRLAAAGYAALPRHVQEALLIWEGTTRAPVDRAGFGLAPRTVERFRRFGQELRRRPDRSAAEIALRPGFGDTYTYYYLFSRVPTSDTVGSTWLVLGREMAALGEVDASIAYFRQALVHDPDSDEAHLALAVALGAHGDVEQAARHLALARRGELGERKWNLGSH